MSTMNLPAPLARLPRPRAGLSALGVGACFAAVAAAALLGLQGFWAFKVTMLLAYALAVRGLQLLVGGSGQVSLGHGAFFAMGAYVTGIAAMQGWVPAFAMAPAAALACAVVGFLFGLPAVRLTGPYLALATFALALALPQLLKHPALEAWTGGVSGLSLLPHASPLPFLSPDQWSLLAAAGWSALGFAAIHRLLSGPCGLAWMSLRDHPTAAMATGVDVARWKAIAFAVSAATVGAAGAIATSVTHFVSPDSFTVFLSLSLLVGVAIAGPRSAAGSIAAAAFLVFVPDLAEKVSREWTGVIYGAVMLGCVYVVPAWQRLRVRRALARSGAATGDRD
jgi:branched-chain amino acid transport system permease protein